MNKVELSGTIANELEVKQTKSGKSLLTVGLAVKRKFPVNGVDVDFVPLVAWEKTAELMRDKLRRGSRVSLRGRIQVNSFDTEQGKKKSMEVIVEEINF